MNTCMIFNQSNFECIYQGNLDMPVFVSNLEDVYYLKNIDDWICLELLCILLAIKIKTIIQWQFCFNGLWKFCLVALIIVNNGKMASFVICFCNDSMFVLWLQMHRQRIFRLKANKDTRQNIRQPFYYTQAWKIPLPPCYSPKLLLTYKPLMSLSLRAFIERDTPLRYVLHLYQRIH